MELCLSLAIQNPDDSFKIDGITEMVNIQNVNGEAKTYQIKKFLSIVEKYGLKSGCIK